MSGRCQPDSADQKRPGDHALPSPLARPGSRRGKADEAGFTLVETLAAGVVLSAVALGLVRGWTALDVTSADLVLRQKAVFVLNGEMERLSALFGVGGLNNQGFGQFKSVADSTLYPAVPGVKGSNQRYVYDPAQATMSPFTVTAYATFAASDPLILSYGTGLTMQNFVWLDRARTILARLSIVQCPVTGTSPTGSATAAACWGNGAAAGTPSACYSFACSIATVILEYPYRWTGNAPVSESTLSGTRLTPTVLTLSSVVGQWQ